MIEFVERDAALDAMLHGAHGDGVLQTARITI